MIEVGRDEPMDDETLESWSTRLKDEAADYRWVEAHRSDHETWPWSVTVAIMEFVRAEDLQDRFVEQMDAALSAVPGVVEVVQEDREVWIVSGQVDGALLVRAAVDTVVGFDWPFSFKLLCGIQSRAMNLALRFLESRPEPSKTDEEPPA